MKRKVKHELVDKSLQWLDLAAGCIDAAIVHEVEGSPEMASLQALRSELLFTIEMAENLSKGFNLNPADGSPY